MFFLIMVNKGYYCIARTGSKQFISIQIYSFSHLFYCNTFTDKGVNTHTHTHTRKHIHKYFFDIAEGFLYLVNIEIEELQQNASECLAKVLSRMLKHTHQDRMCFKVKFL